MTVDLGMADMLVTMALTLALTLNTLERFVLLNYCLVFVFAGCTF